LKDPRSNWRMLLVLILVAGKTVFGTETPAGLSDLPEEVAKVIAETLIPSLGICETVDLDGDGTDEIVVFSGVPYSAEADDSESKTISFQNLLVIFRKGSSEAGAFPYRLSVMKSVSSPTPNPIHVTLENMGGAANREIVWLEGGPDPKGRYSKAILFSFFGNQDPPLVEVARFENPSGWVRVHDLDRDGVAEAIAFSEMEGQTVCPDLLFFQEDRWTSLRTEIQNLGFGDIAGFQSRCGLEPDGRVTRDLLTRFKSYRATGEVPAPAAPTEDALGPIYE